MSLQRHLFAIAPAILFATACAKGGGGGALPDGGGGGGGGGGARDAAGVDSCIPTTCDSDGDGVVDANDQCPNTPPGEPVNHNGCADSQLTPMLEPTFPPYGLTFTSTGDPGRAGGLTWSYTGIDRGDLFHIYWIICDDPTQVCGVSLDGPIDTSPETFVYSGSSSALPNGDVVFTNTTQILLASGSSTPLNGRMTMTIVDGSGAPVPFSTVQNLQVPARAGAIGAEILGSAFTVTALVEVQDASLTWTPYLDYYDAASTPGSGSGAAISIGGDFYDK